jgi:DNA-binding MarR family transcriptional regulator
MPLSGTSRLCDRLIAKGLMRKRPDPHSGRSIELSVTPSGVERVGLILDARRDELSDALAKIPAEERGALRDALTLLADSLGEPREPLVALT